MDMADKRVEEELAGTEATLNAHSDPMAAEHLRRCKGWIRATVEFSGHDHVEIFMAPAHLVDICADIGQCDSGHFPFNYSAY